MIGRLLTHWQEHGYGLWAVEQRSTGTLLGRCGLQRITETDEVEIDFILDPASWGQRFCHRSRAGSLKLALRSSICQRSWASSIPKTWPRSASLRESWGMQFAAATEYFGMTVHRYVITQPDFVTS
ncbi:MAG: GNAT family protein [Chloroflexota bacterium]